MSLSSQTLSESHQFDTSNNRPTSPDAANAPVDVLLSLGTVPVLLGLWGGKAISSLMRELGQASEEVFRGDRLPVLNFPTAPTSAPEESED
ncbi:hypothetical protein [Microcoleus sp. FACHB-672]|uniref:hypothetical protein n=1 Tax=Microcoleus sp. FACHB-672 TaxID=2692825 RepID=UPI0016824697|nr:hypothetical protein [Microcoleus sp. FACHB-672]MBD2039621.1 hypothetical protein [Microcoleus sp. FACHB-672]